MNLVLVSIHIAPSSRAVSLGAASLAAAVNQALGDKIDTHLFDCTLQQSAAVSAQAILGLCPDAVGLSMTVWNRDLALDIARRLKTAKPHLIVFAGGPEVTATPKQLTQLDELDFVLTGEGENKLAAALHHLLQEEVPTGSEQDIPPDLSDLPSPYLTGILQPQLNGGALWELSRGCPYRCDFCFESRGSAVVRRFPLERIRAELELFAACEVREVFVLDPTFNYHKQTAREMLEMMAKFGQGLHFSLEIRAELVDEELAQLFASIDCTLQIGLQSADTEVLRAINRDFDPEEFRDKVLLLHEAGVSYGFDLIYGLPGDNLPGFLASLDFALSLRPNHIDIFPLAVLPGTRLAVTAAGLGLHYQQQHPYRVLSSATFGTAEMAKAARIATACDFFYNQGRAVPWFSMILDYLELLPSEFFTSFAATMPVDLPADPVVVQRRFVGEQFQDRQQPELAALAGDLIAYFGYVEALYSKPSPKIAKAGSELSLNPQSCFVTFHYDPHSLEDHLAADITDLEELAFFLERVDQEYFCCLIDESLQMYPLTQAQSDYLKSLSSSTPEPPPSPEFIEEALAAGILLRNS